MNADEYWNYLNRESERQWDNTLRTNPLGKLRLCEALWARYDTERDQGNVALAERREWLRMKAAGYLRDAEHEAVLADYTVSKFILRLWNRWPRKLQ